MTTQSVSTGNTAVNNISNSYQQRVTDEDPLGMDAFLTMLVAQLQNQDPLNPMEGTEFSTQLAQFSQLEQAMNTNKNLEKLIESQSKGEETDLQNYIGKNVVAEVDSMEVDGGEAVGGYFTVEKPTDIRITVYDSKGNVVRKLFPGQVNPGSHAVNWDGKDDNGKAVPDGNYRYKVIGSDGTAGYVPVKTTIAGKVDGIINKDGSKYLQVGNAVVKADSVLKIATPPEKPTVDPVSYIGKKIEATTGVIGLSGGKAPEVKYKLDRDDEVKVRIIDSAGNLVREMSLGKQEKGDRTFTWDGQNGKNVTAPNGVYSYQILTKGAHADPRVVGDVEGVVYVDDVPFLQVGENLVNPAAVVKVAKAS